MNLAVAAFALAGMVPAMADGALVDHHERMELALCSGVSIALNSSAPARPANAPCCAKGCQGGERRRKGEFDPAQ